VGDPPKEKRKQMTKINNSSIISEIGYNQLKEELTVTMNKAPVTSYVYRGVDSKLANNLLSADSKGSFFNNNIKGKFTSTKVVS